MSNTPASAYKPGKSEEKAEAPQGGSSSIASPVSSCAVSDGAIVLLSEVLPVSVFWASTALRGKVLRRNIFMLLGCVLCVIGDCDDVLHAPRITEAMERENPGVIAAYREGQARGLPDGWTCTIDKRNRRKWTSPNGRSCDSIPKALQMSIELGLLPKDFVVANKRPKPPTKKKAPRRASNEATIETAIKEEKRSSSVNQIFEKEEEAEDQAEDGGQEVPLMDPDRSLDGPPFSTATTVNWDPDGIDGRKVGWRCKVETSKSVWSNGRIARYDPYTHKHLIVAEKNRRAWVWLRNREHNIRLATRIVWAHVKGYAWWPALVFESNEPDERSGYVEVEFFGSREISNLRDTEDNIRPFSPDSIDAVVAKHKKKRNKQSYDLSCKECRDIQVTRNAAAIWYADKAIHHVNRKANSYLGKRVKVFRSDLNYPYGETVVGKVKGYSGNQKKWLLTFELGSQNRKFPAAWVNLHAKEASLRVLDKGTTKTVAEDLLPFVYGFKTVAEDMPADQVAISKLMNNNCHSCCEGFLESDTRCLCSTCGSHYHVTCTDPPFSPEAWQRMQKDGTDFVCSRCLPCRGCYGKDICFGSQPSSAPPSLDFPENETLLLCGMCKDAYDEERYCPNCRHSWDDDKRQNVQRQMKLDAGKKRKRSSALIQDTVLPLDFGSFHGDEEFPEGATYDPAFFHPETSEWGFTEGQMLVCDACEVWLHAGCAGVGEAEYNTITEGNHPVYSKEFLCKVCCRQRCKDLISALQAQDSSGIFSVPVTEKVAPNYHDIIKTPMDLFTMSEMADREHADYVWVREKFELMVLNALTFNKNYSAVWHEAKRYYQECLKTIFRTKGKAAPRSQHFDAIEKSFQNFEEERKKEAERVQVDARTEKKDLVAGSIATSIKLPTLCEAPPDVGSCVPFTETQLLPRDGFYCSWMECCYTCGSSGASDTMMFCVDCGEAYHSFCANVPIRSMDQYGEASWRCPNCKICEISGEVPEDETKMLFCEMCDRGFNLSLLDPPLELQAAPPGLWICGQCVECAHCDGTLDPNGASLAHWSSHSEKCYRCGGCEGLVDKDLSKLKCKVCTKLIRFNELRAAQCKKCKELVHVSCDPRASRAFKEATLLPDHNSRQQRSDALLSFECMACFKPKKVDPNLGRQHLHSQAWSRIVNGDLPCNDECSKEELFVKLTEEIDWEIRHLWSSEYLSVIEEAMRVYKQATSRYGDARLVIQHVLGTSANIPFWTSQRALRFIWVARRAKWDSSEIVSANSTASLVASAKLAASFLHTVCPTMGIDTARDLSCNIGFLSKLMNVSPNKVSICNYPADELRANVDDLASKIVRTELPRSLKSPVNLPTNAEEVVTATALCGWEHLPHISNHMKWKDPRECSFCHLRGDDDAGFHDSLTLTQNASEYPLPSLGRLLPMANGHWVHTLCALWSSEVWEAANDGLVHAVEKARARGAQLKCFGCGRPGATVGCNKSNCSFNYHFPCAKVCGAVFTADQHVYCKNHKASASRVLPKEGFEYMKALMIAPEDRKAMVDTTEASEVELLPRVGALIVHSLGDIEQQVDGFHSEEYLTPPGYMATRIYWSFLHARSRTVYVLKIGRTDQNRPEFSILPGDDPDNKILGETVEDVYNTLMERVKNANSEYFRKDSLFSKMPTVRQSRHKAFGLNGAQLFGFGLNHIRRLLEARPGVEAAVAQLNKSSPMYKFCFTLPTIDSILDLQRKRAASRAEQALENSTGCARTEGMRAFDRSGGSGRITRALVRSAEDTAEQTAATAKTSTEKAQADKNLNQVKYRQMKSIPTEDRLAARRSHIHGWGLFTKMDIHRDNPIIEYCGEVIRQSIADQRERAYEISGEGSCYMFRLDLNRIVDATKIGCMARFMNHCCKPNAYAKIITVDSENLTERSDKKIVVFANRDIAAGEEITYDYKFPVEDGSLRCTCGAPNCIGRLN